MLTCAVCKRVDPFANRSQTKDSLRRGGRRDAQGPGGPHFLCLALLRKALREQGPPGRIAGSQEGPGSAPKLDEKAMKLLEEDLRERPFATLQERRDYVEVLTGISVSRSTVWRAIARIGPTRKKGGE